MRRRRPLPAAALALALVACKGREVTVFETPLAAGSSGTAGALLSGFVTYSIGRHLGRDTVRRLAGARLNQISRKLAERGLLAVVLVRMVPVAPYSVVNMVAGASHIRLRDFMLGTLLAVSFLFIAV